MNITEREAFFSGASWCRKVSALLLAFALLFAVGPLDLRAAQDQPAPPESPKGPAYETQSPEQLQQLVAPIALYPDSLVAQILGAATFPGRRLLQPATGRDGRHSGDETESREGGQPQFHAAANCNHGGIYHHY